MTANQIDMIQGIIWILFAIASYYIGYNIGRGKKQHLHYKSEACMNTPKDSDDIDIFVYKLLKLVEEARRDNKRLSITENREGSIVYCEDLKTRGSASISKIDLEE